MEHTKSNASQAGEMNLSEKRTANGGEVVVEIPTEVEISSKPIIESEKANQCASKPREEQSSVDSPSRASTELTPHSTKPMMISSSSPEQSRYPHSSNKPPKIPDCNETIIRKRSLSRSVYSKPKSRFGEEPYRINSNMFEENYVTSQERVSANSPHRYSFNQTSPGNKSQPTAVTPKTPLMASSDLLNEYDDDEEIFKKVELNKEKHKRPKLKIIVEWIGFLVIMSCLIATLTHQPLKSSVFWGLESWKWCLLIMVTFCGLLVTTWFMHFIVFLIEMNFLLRKKVLYFVHGLKKTVQVTIWLALVLLTWMLLFDQHDHTIYRSKTTNLILHDVTMTLVSLLIGAFLWLLKTLFLKVLASNFHVNQFFDRIQEAIFHQYVLQTLSGPPLIEEAERVGRLSSMGQMSIKRSKNNGKKEKEVIDMGKLHKMKQEKVSAWTMKVLVDAVTNSELSTISQALEESFQNREDEQPDSEITNEMEAIAAAFKIFRNVAQPGSKRIEEDDLLRFMIKEEVELVFQLFDGSETRKIDKACLTNWVVKVYQGRKTLAHALNDTKTAVKQLNKLVTGIVIVVTIVMWLLLIEITTSKVLVFLGSQLVVAVFIFGNTCKTIFEALIFVFVMHPFDVGDRCVIDGNPMMVEEMNILTTVFLKLNKEKVYYPNSVLATKPISNYFRSPNMSDAVEFTIDFMTPLERIGAMKEKIKSYLEKNPTQWQPSHNVVVKEIENVNEIKIALNVNHTMNFQDWVEKNRRRSELVMELKKIFHELNIKYNLLHQRVHLCNVEDSCFSTH